MKRAMVEGIYTKNDDGSLDVLILLPEAVAKEYGLESQWEFTVNTPEDPALLQQQILDLMEEQLLEELDEDLCGEMMDYLWDENNWDGEISEAQVLDGREAVSHILLHTLS